MAALFPSVWARGVGVLVLATAMAGLVAAANPELISPPRVAEPWARTPEAKADRALMTEIRERSEIMDNLRHLSDRIGPRLTGSKNLEQANRWTAEKMKDYGLENVRLEPWEIPVGWKRGTATGRLVSPDTGRSLMLASAGWSPGTDGPVQGPVVVMNLKTKGDLAKYKGKLKNAIVLRSPPATVSPVTDLRYGPPAVPKNLDPKAKSEEPQAKPAPKPQAPPPIMNSRQFRRELEDFLRAEGAAAVLVDSAKPHGLLVTTGAWRDGDRATEQTPLPVLFTAHEHYSLLYRLATQTDQPKPIVEIDVKNEFVDGPITVYNTVGEVRGSEFPDEFVVVGAHLDSWDLGTGTTDNGTGSSVVLEVARAIAARARAGYPPKRTIRFVLFSGEEQGLHGSKAYVRRHKDEMPKTSAALVHDTGTGQVLGFGLQGREAVRQVLEPELVSLNHLDGWVGLDLRSMGGTDHLSFEAVGVPGFACRQDMDEYRLTHHTQSDTFGKAKEPNLVQGAQAVGVTAYRIANLPELLPRQRPGQKTPKREPKSEQAQTEKEKVPATKPEPAPVPQSR